MRYDTKLEAKIALEQMKKESGEKFEQLVAAALKRYTGNGFILKNLCIPTGKGYEFNEIDVVMIHETGIYVVECKDHKGTVTGAAQDKLWHTSYKSGHRFTFYNPIHQNEDHIYSLSRALKLPEYCFKSWVVFGSLADALLIPQSAPGCTITRFSTFRSKLTTELETEDIIFTDDEVNTIYEILSSPRYASTREKMKTQEERLKNIGRRY